MQALLKTYYFISKKKTVSIFDLLKFSRFFSQRYYHDFSDARVAELVDAADLKSVSSNGVRVQVPPRALF